MSTPDRITTLAATFADVTETGTFSGTAATYGTRIERAPGYAQKIMPGAFSKQLADPTRVKILWQHNREQPIGTVTAFEDDRNTLRLAAKLTDSPDVPQAREALALMREGIIDELSVGFDWVKWEEQRTDDGLLIVHRQARLREISVVTFGALGRNARAMTVNSAPKRQGSSVTSWRERFARLDS